MNRPQDPEAVNAAGGSISEPGSVLRHRWFVLACLALLLLAIGACWSTVFPGNFHLDDLPNIAKNSHLWRWLEKKEPLVNLLLGSPAKFRPLAYLTFAWNAAPGKLNPAVYLKTNIALHMAAAVSVFLFYSAFLGIHFRKWSLELRRGVSLMGASLWALNPLQTAAVSYSVQRMTVMAALFSVIALWGWLKWRETGGRGWPLLILVSFTLGMGSKEITATVPLVILLYEWLYRSDLPRRAVHWVVIAIMVALPAAIYALYIQRSAGNAPSLEILPNRDFNSLERIYTQGRVLWHYVSLWTLPLPDRLILDYSTEVSRSLVSPPVTLAAWSAWAGLVAYLISKRRTFTAVTFAVLSYLAFNSVESSFLNLALVFQHRLYLPSVALAGLAAGGLGYLVHNGKLKPAQALIPWSLALACFAPVTLMRNREWSSAETLLRADIERNPDSARPYFNLAKRMGDKGNPEERLDLLTKAVDKGYGNDACLEITEVEIQEVLFARADALFEECEKKFPPNTDLYLNWGAMNKKAKNYEKAESIYQKALVLSPDNVAVMSNLASAKIGEQKFEEALEILEQAHALSPKNSTVYINKMVALARLGRGEDAYRTMEELELATGRTENDKTFRTLIEVNLKKAQAKSPDGTKKTSPGPNTKKAGQAGDSKAEQKALKELKALQKKLSTGR